MKKNQSRKKHVKERKTDSANLKGYKQNQQSRYLFEFSPAISFIVDMEGFLIDANRSVLEVLGYNKSEIIGKHCLDFVVEDFKAQASAELQKVFSGQWTPEMELQIRSKDGSIKSIILAPGHAFIYKNGHPIGVLMTGIDITNRKLIEKRLHDIEKMEALFGLCSLLGHEFNNLFAVIINYIKILLKDSRIPQDIAGILNEISDATWKAINLSKKLSDFGLGKVNAELEKVDVMALIQKAREKIPDLKNGNINFEVNCSFNQPLAYSNSELLEQILINILTNSVEAIENKKGKISIEISKTEYSNNLMEIYPPSKSEKYIKIVIADDGIGMGPETARRALEPFFTTKDAKNHQGLGLSIAYGLAKRIRGNLSIESGLNKGTKVTITLPEYE